MKISFLVLAKESSNTASDDPVEECIERLELFPFISTQQKPRLALQSKKDK